jgi:hypothetical protein
LPAARRFEGVATVSILTVYAFLVLGYHPFAEDGGVYAAGIRKLLDPTLYPAYTAFVTEHLRFSLFAPTMAACVRITGVALDWVLLAAILAALWLTLYGGWMLAARLNGRGEQSLPARVGAVVILAGALSIPLAGTSLYLVDPYLTARSLSTPLGLLALAWALDAVRGRPAAWIWCAGALSLAAMLHPLMAGYTLAAVVVLAVIASPWPRMREWGPVALAALAIACAGVVQALAPPENPEYLRIVATRFYWFPFAWHWYEQLGLLGPLAVIWVLARTLERRCTPAAREGLDLLVRTTLILAGISLLVAACFARAGLQTHMVARMQPLRCFQLVYTVMLLLGGMWLGERMLKRSWWRWAVVLVVLGAGMFAVQRDIYASSNHLEIPGRAPRNTWVQAFLWIRENTPEDAVFALDAHYITQGRHEDAQCFRAIAERSALPDYSKDGGEASITPSLAAAWARGQAAQTGLETEPDATRAAATRPLGATWIVLERQSRTAWDCPYRNGVVQVCRIP